MIKKINHNNPALAALHRACSNGEPIVGIPAKVKQSLTQKIQTKTELTDAEIEAAVKLFGSRCSDRKKYMLKCAFRNVPHITDYGIFGRVMFGEDGETVSYCTGQSYPDEIRTVRECLIGR